MFTDASISNDCRNLKRLRGIQSVEPTGGEIMAIKFKYPDQRGGLEIPEAEQSNEVRLRGVGHWPEDRNQPL